MNRDEMVLLVTTDDEEVQLFQAADDDANFIFVVGNASIPMTARDVFELARKWGQEECSERIKEFRQRLLEYLHPKGVLL